MYKRQELLDAGCTHPVILKCLNSDTNQLSRYRGFQRALAERGIVEDPHLYVDLPEVTSEKASDAIVWLLEKGFHFDGDVYKRQPMSLLRLPAV